MKRLSRTFLHRDRISLITLVKMGLSMERTEIVAEYYPEEHKEYSNAIDTKASLVRLRGLDSGTTFRLRIRSAYQGVFSQELIDTTFSTQGTANYDYSSSAETYSVRTLPPNFNLRMQTTTEMTSYEYSKESEEETTVTSEQALTEIDV